MFCELTNLLAPAPMLMQVDLGFVSPGIEY